MHGDLEQDDTEVDFDPKWKHTTWVIFCRINDQGS